MTTILPVYKRPNPRRLFPFARPGSFASSVVFFAICASLSHGQTVYPLNGHKEFAGNFAFSPDGKFVASRGQNEVIVWRTDVESETERVVWKTRHKNFSLELGSPMVFSNDSRRLAAGWREDGGGRGKLGLRIWDAKTGVQQHEFMKTPSLSEGGFHKYFAFTPSDKEIISTADHRLASWNLVTGKSRVFSETDTGDTQFIRFSPDGSRVITARKDGLIKAWDFKSGTLKGMVKVSTRGLWSNEGGANSKVFHGLRSVVVSPDCKTAAASEADPDRVIIWNLLTGRPLKAINTQHTRHLKQQGVGALSWSADGKWIVWRTARQIALCSVERGYKVKLLTFPQPRKNHFANFAVVSPKGKYLAYQMSTAGGARGGNEWGGGNELYLWDITHITAPKKAGPKKSTNKNKKKPARSKTTRK